MKTQKMLTNINLKPVLVSIAIAIALSVFMVVPAFAASTADSGTNQSKTAFGSGAQYKTTVQRSTSGELSSEDLHQVTLLSSRIVNHVNRAASYLTDADKAGAGDEIEQAQKLFKVVRDMLPVTTVTTTVQDSAGKEVYKSVDKVQKDIVPLYRGAVSVEIVEPLIEAKEKEAALKGVRLSDVEVLHTSLAADLKYIERKLARARKLLDTPELAHAQLMLAQDKGMKFSVNKADDPLVEVQAALRLAERMVHEERFGAALENLRLAQLRLESYRVLIDDQPTGKVKELQDEITELLGKIEDEDSAGKIRKFWERVVSWFQKVPGEAEVTSKAQEDKEAE